MEDNLDVFRWFLVDVPRPWTLLVLQLVCGVVFGGVSTWVLSPATGLRTNLIGGIVVSLFFYIVPALVTGVVLTRAAGITRAWAYLVSLVDEGIVFLFSMMVVFADSMTESWQVLWLAVATVYVANLLMIAMARGKQKLYTHLLYALVFPGLVLVLFHVFIGRLVGIPKLLYLRNSALILVSAVFLLFMLWMFDFLVRANVSGLSALDFTSVLILGEEKSIPGGVNTNVRHQALHIEPEDGDTFHFNIPWTHPGPVEGFGGGKLTERLIDDDTFFLHVPCDHSLDLADPADIDRFRELPDGPRSETATTLHRLEQDGFTVWGRKYGDARIVYIQNRAVDDYDAGLIEDIAASYDNICLVDLHNQDVHDDNSRLQAVDPTADMLRGLVDRMVDELDAAEQHAYRAGMAGTQEYRCLVEEVNGQTTCILGIDGNDAPPVLRRVEDELQDRFDEILVYTTDSHKRLVELARPDSYDRDILIDAAETAEEQIDKAAAGIGERMVNGVRVLGEDYAGIIFTMNIMARLVPIALFLYYVALVFLIL